MKLKFFIAFSAIAILTFIAVSQIKKNAFAPAEILPREALIYVQFADLPAFVKLWNESKLNEKYTSSENFSDFRNNHLGRKLLSRWEEFDEASGFPIDLETISKLANDQAAIAVYDIGKLEFVFVAPVSDEIFAATKFVQNKDKFTEETLDDGTKIYRANVEADRGRQKQSLIFTGVKNQFVLATSEKLLMQTVNNINDSKTKNRLIDEPDFQKLIEKTNAHTATVWVNQTVLNDDYYFKHYWLMSDVKNLKRIRAGIFDFEMREEKLIETRRFLLNETMNVAPIDKNLANEMRSFLPETIPFYKLQRADSKKINETLEKTIFESRNRIENDFEEQEIYAPDGYTSENYEYLGEQFDAAIDDVSAEKSVEKKAGDFESAKSFESAAPQAILTFTEPKILPAPRFVEFQRAAVFNLSNASNFNRTAFESAIVKKFAEQILVASADANLSWETKTKNNSSRRELDFPMLNQKIVYAVRGNNLILSNDADFLEKILAAKTENKLASDKTFSDLTVINLERKNSAFDEVFNRINKDAAEGNFFTGNVSSLLDSISEVKRIEIRRNFSANNFEEELIFALQ